MGRVGLGLVGKALKPSDDGGMEAQPHPEHESPNGNLRPGG